MLSPRPYQSDVLNKILNGFGSYSKQLVVMPTGSGKSPLFAWLAKALQPKRTLILAHRDELIEQAIDKVRRATGIEAEKEKAESHASLTAPIVVASVQTMIRRLDDWPKDHFGLVVADEAHHSISASWQKVLTHFDSFAWVLGVTATPDRGDQRNLGAYYENVAAEVALFDLVDLGFLSPITLQAVPLKIDLSKVHQTAGDFDAGELSDALEPYLRRCAEAISEHAADRRVLVFLPLIATSQKFVKHALDVGFDARHIDGNSHDRAEVLRKFEAGQFNLLSNAMLLTEGYDCPPVDCVVVLRPTKSRPLYSQMCGRGTRVHPGKTDLLLIDFLWLHERHRLVHPTDLVSLNEELSNDATTEAFTAGSQGKLDLRNLVSETVIKRERKLSEELALKAKKKAKYQDALEFAASMHAVEVLEWQDTMRWHSQKPSEAQLAMLTKHGIDPDSIRSKGHASAVIALIIKRSKLDLASPKQMRLAAKLGHKDPGSLRFDQAKHYIDARLGKKPKPDNVPF